MSAKRQPREFTVAEIAASFDVAGASYWWGERWCPAVFRRDGGGFAIRYVKTRKVSGDNVTVTYDFFELDDTGLIRLAPRGWARVYKPGRVVDIAEAALRNGDLATSRAAFGLPS